MIALLSSLTLILGLNVEPLNTTKLAVVFSSFVNVAPSIVAVGATVSDLLTGILTSSVEPSGYVIVAPTLYVPSVLRVITPLSFIVIAISGVLCATFTSPFVVVNVKFCFIALNSASVTVAPVAVTSLFNA